MLLLFSLCAPLLGTFLPPLAAFFILSVVLFLKHGMSMYSVTFGLPTIVATLCWIVERQSTRHAQFAKFLLNVVLPLACVITFVMHPVSGHAIVYSLYWLIPPTLYIFSRGSLLNVALRITFVTHALGSVLWLYAVPTTAAFWLALIPVVAVERLCFAGVTAGMVGCVTMVKQQRYNRINSLYCSLNARHADDKR